MKTLIIAAASALTIGTFASAAMAQDTSNNADVGRVYGSLGVQGQDNHKTGSNLGSVNARVGTKITPHFGVEGEAAFGTNKDTTSAGDYRLTNKVGVYGVGYLPVSSNIDLLGRVGVSDTDLKAPASAGKLEQGTAVDYGVGAQYHFNRDYAARVDYTKSDFQNHKGTTGTTSVSLVKKF
ncbi:porin family protein [Asticcacaulis solisilvae]|uniref:porin family protein n=1 Tax=Asticcacaulis solisilvae TaxID=1217274 RepID=UPI003FD79530